jgi:signal transduction histidine kinase
MVKTLAIKAKYKNHKINAILHKSVWVALLILVVVSYFLFSDFVIRDVPYGFWVYLRLLPIAISLMYISLCFSPLKKRKRLLLSVYYVLLSSLLIMMLGISARTYQTELFSSAIAGVIIIVFAIFIAARTGYKSLLPIYLIPIALFIIYHLIFDTNITPKEFADFSNPAALMIGAIILAEIQERMRFKEFSLRYKLKAEKEKSEELYNEVLLKTASLQQANIELGDQKLKIEQQHNKLYEQNQRLIESEEKLKKSLQVKDKLFSVVAHDLRSPFTGLVGLTKIFASKPEKFSQQQVANFSSQIHQSATKLLVLIENLLNWSRSQTGNITLSPKKISVHRIASDTLNICKVQAQSKNIELINDIQADEHVYADVNTFSVVLRNLVSNALKFTNKNGTIRLSSYYEKGNIRILIADTGVGIEPQKLKTLFNLEHSKTTPGTSNETGTGLGLIVCKEFVEKNNGTISINSKVGEGTTVTISLPTQ